MIEFNNKIIVQNIENINDITNLENQINNININSDYPIINKGNNQLKSIENLNSTGNININNNIINDNIEIIKLILIGKNLEKYITDDELFSDTNSDKNKTSDEIKNE